MSTFDRVGIVGFCSTYIAGRSGVQGCLHRVPFLRCRGSGGSRTGSVVGLRGIRCCLAASACAIAVLWLGAVSASADVPNYIAGDDATRTTINDGLEIDVLANDTLPAGYHVADLVLDTSPAHGTAEVVDSQEFDRQAILYSPDHGYEGIDSFVYESCVAMANEFLCDDASVTVTIKGSDVPSSSTTSTASTTPTTSTMSSTVLPVTTFTEVVGQVTGEVTSAPPTVSGNATTSTTVLTAAELPRTGARDAWARTALAALGLGAVIVVCARPRRRYGRR
jgi:Bacterial Ig domain